ncbi:MAG TPA: hypothetical protein VFU96_02245 [Acidimicrobiia bacterium]|nr:hypothetical protein [Acidimicrobiia bacterium]
MLYAAVARNPMNDDPEGGHSDGYLPMVFVGPFKTEEEATTHGVAVTIHPWTDEDESEGDHVVLWFGRYGTWGLFGCFKANEVAGFEYEDELTATHYLGESSVSVELVDPEEFASNVQDFSSPDDDYERWTAHYVKCEAKEEGHWFVGYGWSTNESRADAYDQARNYWDVSVDYLTIDRSKEIE